MLILLIEDNPGDVVLLREMLGTLEDSPEIIEADRLSIGAEQCSHRAFDVVLLDLSLPDSHGLETVWLAKGFCGHLPIIVLTSLADEQVAMDALQSGAQDYLVKGRITTELLSRAMRYAMERHKNLRAIEQARAGLEQKVRDRTAALTHTVGVLQTEVVLRKEAEENLRRVNQTLRLVTAANEAMMRIRDEQELTQEICRLAVEEGGHVLSWMGYAEHDARKSIRIAATAGKGGEETRHIGVSWAGDALGGGPSGMAIQTGEPRVIPDLQIDPRVGPWREIVEKYELRSAAALPLRGDGNVFGVFSIYSKELNAFGDEEIEILKQLADDLAFGLTTMRAVAERRRLQQELINSAEREQCRIGQDLHDIVMGQLTGVSLLADNLGNRARNNQLQGDELSKELAHIGQLIRETLGQMRGLVHGLCPITMAPGGLKAALGDLAEATMNIFHIECRLNYEQPVRVNDVPLARQLYYICREAVTNAARHSQSRLITIAVDGGPGELRMRIIDNGRGISDQIRATSTGMGLRTMASRAEMIGAELEIIPTEPQGTTVHCHVRHEAISQQPDLR